MPLLPFLAPHIKTLPIRARTEDLTTLTPMPPPHGKIRTKTPVAGRFQMPYGETADASIDVPTMHATAANGITKLLILINGDSPHCHPAGWLGAVYDNEKARSHININYRILTYSPSNPKMLIKNG